MTLSLPNLGSLFAGKPKPEICLGAYGPLGLRRYWVGAPTRAKHAYVIGITGKGKSKLIEHCLFQDIVAGHGCGVLDPQGDLALDTIRYLGSHPRQSAPHWQRIVYFDPKSDYLIPFNVLASKTEDTYTTVENVIEAFRRTWPDSLKEAARFAEIARAALLTLAANKLTLLELRRLLTDKDYRDTLLHNVGDPEVVEFFHREFDRWGREQPHYISSLLNKSSAFLFSPALRLCLGHRDNQLDLRKIMDEGKVLICNLGGLDGETRRLIGSLITAQMEQVALSRSAAHRRPFYFYIDEFQEVCANEGSSQTLSQVLSQSRKFGLHLTLANQTLGALSRRVQTALNNIQTTVVFGVGRADAEVLAKRLFLVDTEAIKHEPQTETQIPLYSPLLEQWERATQTLQTLEDRHAYVKAEGRAPVRIKTITVEDNRCSQNRLATLCTALARQSGRPRSELEREIAQRSARHATAGKATRPVQNDTFWVEKPVR